MGLTLWNLFKAALLVTNSVAILNRQRFLQKHGLDNVGTIEPTGLKAQVAGLLQAVQYLKVPLIGVNTLTIIFEMILGGWNFYIYTWKLIQEEGIYFFF